MKIYFVCILHNRFSDNLFHNEIISLEKYLLSFLYYFHTSSLITIIRIENVDVLVAVNCRSGVRVNFSELQPQRSYSSNFG
jgi:hypothetical protein